MGDNGEVMVVNGFQTWTVVGAIAGMLAVFSAVMVAAFSALRSELRSMIDASTGRVESKFGMLESKFDGLESKFDVLEAKFDVLEAKFDTKIDNLAHVTDVRLTAVEADLHLVKAHLIGQRSA